MKDNYFDGEVAARYDSGVASAFDAELLRVTVDRLAELANDGHALEFAIGTGRVALPLAERGISVTGIEFSDAMVAQLRKKTGGESSRIPVVVGDMTTATAQVQANSVLSFLSSTQS